MSDRDPRLDWHYNPSTDTYHGPWGQSISAMDLLRDIAARDAARIEYLRLVRGAEERRKEDAARITRLSGRWT